MSINETGIELIVKERQEQLLKHNRTVEKDANENTNDQLLEAILLLIYAIAHEDQGDEILVKNAPFNWNQEIWDHILKKSQKEKLAILGAFAAAEIDRRNYLETFKK